MAANTTVILVQAINLKGEKSEPIKMYHTPNGVLRGEFVLKVTDAGVNQNGYSQVRVGNFGLGLVGTHSADYVEDKLTGFRRKSGEEVYIKAEKYVEEFATAKSLDAITEEF